MTALIKLSLAGTNADEWVSPAAIRRVYEDRGIHSPYTVVVLDDGKELRVRQSPEFIANLVNSVPEGAR